MRRVLTSALGVLLAALCTFAQTGEEFDSLLQKLQNHRTVLNYEYLSLIHI